MRKVWKYILNMSTEQILHMPGKAKILAVQMQRGFPQLWALVDPQAHSTPRTILIVGTGHIINRHNISYIATIQDDDGFLIWHIFEVIE